MILRFNCVVPRVDKYPCYKRNEVYNDLNLFRLEDADTCEIDLCGKYAKAMVSKYQQYISRYPEFKNIKAMMRAGHVYLVKLGEE